MCARDKFWHFWRKIWWFPIYFIFFFTYSESNVHTYCGRATVNFTVILTNFWNTWLQHLILFWLCCVITTPLLYAMHGWILAFTDFEDEKCFPSARIALLHFSKFQIHNFATLACIHNILYWFCAPKTLWRCAIFGECVCARAVCCVL